MLRKYIGFITDRTLSEVRRVVRVPFVTAWRTACLYGVSHSRASLTFLNKHLYQSLTTIRFYQMAKLIKVLFSQFIHKKFQIRDLSIVLSIVLFLCPAFAFNPSGLAADASCGEDVFSE